MGLIIDLEKRDKNERCSNIKLSIVLINLIGPPISLIMLIVGIIIMILKRRKSFLSNLIILIFSSEIVQCLSKLIQILKYSFIDRRDQKYIKTGDTPRGIICQIQICLAIFSDFLSLLSTLLLSLRCYDVINNKIRFFDKRKNKIISVIIIISLSIASAVIFIFVDRARTGGNVAYRYDVRDRCTYWCWLEHTSSLFCYGLYWVIIIFNIYFALTTYSKLKKGYQTLLEENRVKPKKINDLTESLTEGIKEEEDMSRENKRNKSGYNILSLEQKVKIEQLRVMKAKSLIYPTITICYWLFAATYRIIDDLVMREFDDGDPNQGEIDERDYFEKHPLFQFAVKFFLIVYTFLSSIRGILYGFSFIVFEEKIFFNFFQKIVKRFSKNRNSIIINDEKESIIRNSGDPTTSNNELSIKKNGDKNDDQSIESNPNDNDDDSIAYS